MSDVVFFRGFDVMLGRISSPVRGEHYSMPSLTIQGDDVNVAECVRRISRGELVPMRELRYGMDASSMDPIDLQQDALDQRQVDAGKSDPDPDDGKADPDDGKADPDDGNK